MVDETLKRRNACLNSMANRLGMITHHQYNIENGDLNTVEWNEGTIVKTDPTIINNSGLALRLHVNGGYDQQSRMVYDKKRTLDRVLNFSYQGANVRKIRQKDIGPESDWAKMPPYPMVRALINPDKTKMDYDDKIISIPFECGLGVGDIFEWCGTNSYWLIYLQDMNEIAYFRGEIRKCQYEISWEDEDGMHTTYAAIRGPVETKIDYIQKHQISVDNPNYSLHILMPRTEQTLKHFKRYTKFYLQNPEPGAENVCWRVEAIDWISTPGILEINAVEYYANETEDDVENGIVGAFINESINPNENNPDAERIEGETFIKPHGIYYYTYHGLSTSYWKVDTKNLPLTISVNPKDNRQLQLRWEKSHSGQFDISYGKVTKTIVVESLF